MEKNKTLENIQVLRAVAALMVLVYHFTWYLDNFFATKFIANLGSGVILFFVISGFVLWNNLNYEGIFKFYKNRINRIFPSLWLLFLVVITLFFIDEIFKDFHEMSFYPKLKIIFSACGIPFVAGIICRQILNKYKISNTIKFYLFLFSVFLSFLFNIYGDFIFKGFSYAEIQILFSIPYCLLVISVAEVNIKNRVLHLFKKAGDYSYGIYLMHVIIITSFFELYKIYIGSYLDYTLVFFMFIFTIILSLMFGWFEHYLYTLRKKYSKK
jgi:peptidoglycan/LPS O-acetylase OafA/YrhL